MPILPESAIARLREALPRYTRTNPFKVGYYVENANFEPYTGPGA